MFKLFNPSDAALNMLEKKMPTADIMAASSMGGGGAGDTKPLLGVPYNNGGSAAVAPPSYTSSSLDMEMMLAGEGGSSSSTSTTFGRAGAGIIGGIGSIHTDAQVAGTRFRLNSTDTLPGKRSMFSSARVSAENPGISCGGGAYAHLNTGPNYQPSGNKPDHGANLLKSSAMFAPSSLGAAVIAQNTSFARAQIDTNSLPADMAAAAAPEKNASIDFSNNPFYRPPPKRLLNPPLPPSSHLSTVHLVTDAVKESQIRDSEEVKQLILESRSVRAETWGKVKPTPHEEENLTMERDLGDEPNTGFAARDVEAQIVNHGCGDAYLQHELEKEAGEKAEREKREAEERWKREEPERAHKRDMEAFTGGENEIDMSPELRSFYQMRKGGTFSKSAAAPGTNLSCQSNVAALVRKHKQQMKEPVPGGGKGQPKGNAHHNASTMSSASIGSASNSASDAEPGAPLVLNLNPNHNRSQESLHSLHEASTMSLKGGKSLQARGSRVLDEESPKNQAQKQKLE